MEQPLIVEADALRVAVRVAPLGAMQAGDRGFNDFLSRRFTDNAETERIHDQMCRHIEDVLARVQHAGKVRPDLSQADIVNLIWSNGRMIDATSTTAPNMAP